jgi:GMP reductase
LLCFSIRFVFRQVGIGPGSVCTTRKKTGVGYPQLSAVMECADAAHGLGGWIVSDGGCVYPGDLCKAFGGGADFVMLGGMLAGHDQSGGRVIEDANGKKSVEFYGMSSATAMHKHSGSVAEYRASEGKSVTVAYRGPVDATILDILGGLRSACTYVGADKIKDLAKRTTFIRVTQQTNEIFTGRETQH